jgi:hypothetical protein
MKARALSLLGVSRSIAKDQCWGFRWECCQGSSNALRIDLLDAAGSTTAATLRDYSSQPQRLIASVSANTDKNHIVIDEIQKLPQLLDAVPLLMERKAGHS